MPTACRCGTGRCSAPGTTSRCRAWRRRTPSCTRRSAPRSTPVSRGCAPNAHNGLLLHNEYFSALAQPPLNGCSVLQEVALGSKSLADYTHLAGRSLVDEIRELAEKLQGKRVLHVSATAFGGGVSEILYTIVPLMRDVGLQAHWHVIFGKEEFFNATKLLHNSLQGAEESLSEEQWELFDEINVMNADGLQGEWDAVIVHDPQPIGLRRGALEKGKNWIWRCHRPLD